MNVTKEEGELSGSDIEETVYNPILRPDASLYRNMNAECISEDETSESGDSDSDCALPKRKRPCIESSRQSSMANADHFNPRNKKRNNIWSNVLQEEGLMQNIHDVGLKKIVSDRNVESYDYTQALKIHGKHSESDDDDNDENEVNMDKKDEDDSKSEDVRLRLNYPEQFGCKRKREKYKKEKPRYLKEIKIDSDRTDEDFGETLADALFENKADLMVRCVRVLGKQKALDVYNKTKEVEEDGGIMIMNGSRRRTSGGVFLFLLKTFDGVTREHTNEIFEEDTKSSTQMRRKRRAHRKLLSKQNKESDSIDAKDDNCLHIRGLFSDDPGGTKCPGSTPVTTPQGSGSEDEAKSMNGFQSPPLPLKEVFERAALEIEERDSRSQTRSPPQLQLPFQEEMDIV